MNYKFPLSIHIPGLPKDGSCLFQKWSDEEEDFFWEILQQAKGIPPSASPTAEKNGKNLTLGNQLF